MEVKPELVSAFTPEGHFQDRLIVHVDILNTTDSVVRTGIDPCAIDITLNPSSGGVVLIEEPDVNRDCARPGASLVLGGMRQSRLTLSVLSGAFLLRGEAPREYAVAVPLEIGDSSVTLKAGSVTIRPPGRDASSGLDSLMLSNSVEAIKGTFAGVPADLMRVATEVVNGGSWPVFFQTGGSGCRIRTTAHETAEPAAPAVWRSERRLDWDTGRQVASCETVLLSFFLVPGEGHTFDREYAVANILGDTLPDGEYHFRGRLQFMGDTFPTEFGSTVVGPTRVAYPVTRLLDGYTYTLTPEVVAESPTRIRMTMNVRNTANLDLTLTRYYREQCPFEVFALADSMDVGRVPPAEPVWRSHAGGCSGWSPVTLAPGEEHDFVFEFAADEVLSGGAPPGLYFFEVALKVHTEETDAPIQQIRFSGGGVELARYERVRILPSQARIDVVRGGWT